MHLCLTPLCLMIPQSISKGKTQAQMWLIKSQTKDCLLFFFFFFFGDIRDCLLRIGDTW